jgi:Flp pilus assembly pilin Flp
VESSVNGNTFDHSSQSRRKRSRRSRAGRTRRVARRKRRGLTAIEYVFMASIVLVGILLAVQQIGKAVKSSFTTSDSAMKKVGL